VIASAILLASSAHAAPPTPEARQAAEAKKRGDRAMDDLRYDDALGEYKRAYELTKDPALLYNQARASQALGDFVGALDMLERFDAAAPATLKARVPDLAGLTWELKNKVATLTVTCNVPDAEVLLRDTVVGKTPLATPLRITSGRATLVVRAEKYDMYKKELELPGDSTLTLDVQLRLTDRHGIIVVRSIEGAHVWMDGAPRGDVPVEISTTEGSHDVRIERDGYEPSATSAVAVAGEKKDVSITLVKKPPITSAWWFWTGIGVVVAGGVTTAILLTTERHADPGTIHPGVVSGPLRVGGFHF
jgi:hypothetical protein